MNPAKISSSQCIWNILQEINSFRYVFLKNSNDIWFQSQLKQMVGKFLKNIYGFVFYLTNLHISRKWISNKLCWRDINACSARQFIISLSICVGIWIFREIKSVHSRTNVCSEQMIGRACLQRIFCNGVVLFWVLLLVLPSRSNVVLVEHSTYVLG